MPRTLALPQEHSGQTRMSADGHRAHGTAFGRNQRKASATTEFTEQQSRN
jgi:hypothetical protein